MSWHRYIGCFMKFLFAIIPKLLSIVENGGDFLRSALHPAIVDIPQPNIKKQECSLGVGSKVPRRRKIPLQQRPPKKWKSLWRMLYIYIYVYHYIYIYIIIYIYIYLCVSWYIIYIYIYISTKLAKSPLAPYKAGPWSLAGIRIPYFDVVVGRASTATYAGWRAVSFGALAAMAGWNPGRKGKTWKNDLKPWVN